MKTILTCTTTGERLNIFFYTIQSLLRQTIQPDIFIVNIAIEEFGENGNYNIPDWLNNKKVKINLTKDIGSYKKLIPSLEFANNDDIIVTADDDVIYNEKWFEELINSSIKEPNFIICGRARLMRRNIFGVWQNYGNWKICNKEFSSLFLIPVGVDGVVYRKNLLDLDFLLNNDFMQIAPGTDDLWFKMASLRFKTKVKVIPHIAENNMDIRHKKGLEQINIKKQRDNPFIKLFSPVLNKLINYFAINQTRNDRNWDSICSLQLNRFRK